MITLHSGIHRQFSQDFELGQFYQLNLCPQLHPHDYMSLWVNKKHMGVSLNFFGKPTS